ncbi:urocanate hydratase [Streptococcus saliviloxodontae]|uniref:Urocanate hydratase n=1 Tax=Streptococcus saliviloxodontae TaxID=1349416 RepID=A0ABS2PJR4_9STRE|nr:urocanate hydratase [Streptococcus saliviloxodontae]MBM7635674.1 urocanate hydratase [Streptococcus saliviloxodontae]
MTIKAQRGNQLRTKGWRQEALLRLLENVLENGEDPDNLVVYGSLGKAARDWGSYRAIVDSLKVLEEDETLIIQSGKPIGIVKTHSSAPLVIMANGNLVGKWATPEHFYELYEKNLIAWGGLTAGDWQYIGSQGVLQGTYQIFKSIAQLYYDNDLSSKWILTAGMGGMGGSQPLAGKFAGASILVVDVNEENIDKRLSIGYVDKKTDNLDKALDWIEEGKNSKKPISVALIGNAATVYQQILDKGLVPDIVSDQTAAHDLLYGYVPEGYSLDKVKEVRTQNPAQLEQDAGQSLAKEVRSILAFQQRGSKVFDNGNNIRTQARRFGVENAFDIPIFTEAFLRPLFERAIGPFRWIALSGNPDDITIIDDYILEHFADNSIISEWISLAKTQVPFQGLPARIGWLGHEERTALALAVNDLVAKGIISAPVAFTRDHLDAGAMAHPNIMTESLKDGSDAIADWPLLNALLATSSKADLVAIHSGGGGYAGFMQSAGLTIVADGSAEAAERLSLSLTNDTSLGVLRYADAGYEDSLDEVEKKGIRRINTNDFGEVGY